MTQRGRPRTFTNPYRHISYLGANCAYCRASAVCFDHILPLTLYYAIRITQKLNHLLFTVDSCKSCNMLLSDRFFYSFQERLKALHPNHQPATELLDLLTLYNLGEPKEPFPSEILGYRPNCLVCSAPIDRHHKRRFYISCSPCTNRLRSNYHYVTKRDRKDLQTDPRLRRLTDPPPLD